MKARVGGALLVVAAFGALPAFSWFTDWQHRGAKQAAVDHYMKRCKQDAGEKIVQVVHNVEGIFIAKPRMKASELNLNDQFWMGDPYGYSEYEAEYPAETYLFDRSGKTISSLVVTPIRGYAFVEMQNPDYADGNREAKYLRYTLELANVRDGDKVERRLRPVAQPVSRLKSRYAITWDDISTTEDRRMWVAGGRLRIFEILSNKTIAERVGYVIDPQMGQSARGRVIWLHVNQIQGAFCPPFEHDFHKNKEFVGKVLRANAD
jgi:hypothetical protein